MFANRQQRQFEQVVRAYSADLYRFAYWLCKDRFLAEDLVQESFTRAWRHWDQLQNPEEPKAWLLTIVRNEHARLYERKRLDYVDEAPEYFEIAAEHQPIELYELEQLISTLPLTLREPFLLQTLGGFSCGEIAQQLESTEGAIMVRLTRARQALRGLFQPESKTTKTQKLKGR